MGGPVLWCCHHGPVHAAIGNNVKEVFVECVYLVKVLNIFISKRRELLWEEVGRRRIYALHIDLARIMLRKIYCDKL